MQQGAQTFSEAKSALPPEVFNETIRQAAHKLSARDRAIIDFEVRTLASNERLRGTGIMSAREVLARLGVLFLDHPEAFERLKKARSKGE